MLPSSIRIPALRIRSIPEYDRIPLLFDLILTPALGKSVINIPFEGDGNVPEKWFDTIESTY